MKDKKIWYTEEELPEDYYIYYPKEKIMLHKPSAKMRNRIENSGYFKRKNEKMVSSYYDVWAVINMLYIPYTNPKIAEYILKQHRIKTKTSQLRNKYKSWEEKGFIKQYIYPKEKQIMADHNDKKLKILLKKSYKKQPNEIKLYQLTMKGMLYAMQQKYIILEYEKVIEKHKSR